MSVPWYDFFTFNTLKVAHFYGLRIVNGYGPAIDQGKKLTRTLIDKNLVLLDK